MLQLSGDVSDYLGAIGSAGVPPNTVQKLQQLLLFLFNKLIIQFAVTVDIGKPFATATYNLEGDGFLALECYGILSTVSAPVRGCHLLNTHAVVRRIANVTMSEQY